MDLSPWTKHNFIIQSTTDKILVYCHRQIYLLHPVKGNFTMVFSCEVKKQQQSGQIKDGSSVMGGSDINKL